MSGSSPTSNPESSSSTGDAAVPPEKPVVKIPEPVKIEEPAPAILSPHLPPPVTPPPVIASSSPKTSVGDGGRGGIVSRLRGDTPDEGGPRMSFIDHLMELRKRLWVSIITVVVSMFGALAFYDWLFAILRWPLDKINDEYRLPENAANYAKILELLKLPANSDVVQLISTNLLGTMMMVMWIGIGAGLVLSSPVVIFEIWSFISPGLRDKERNAIKPVLYGGIFFFMAGVALTYFLLFPVTLNFVVWLDVQPSFRIRPSYTVDEYLTLLLNMMWITGLICETPLVIGALAKLSVIKASHLTQYWRVCVLGSFLLGSIFSPGTDVMSMIVFSLLLLSLYIVSIFMAWFFYPKQKNENAAQ